MIFNFGDIVLNEHASERNPRRFLLFVRSIKTWIYCLDLRGDQVNFYTGNSTKLRKVDEVDFSGWKKLAEVGE